MITSIAFGSKEHFIKIISITLVSYCIVWNPNHAPDAANFVDIDRDRREKTLAVIINDHRDT